jgi:molecular chaperone DnaK (HSP70)
MLSANTEAPLSIEMLMNDVDVKSTMNRDLFEKLAEPVLKRLHKPLQQVLAIIAASCVVHV